MTDLSKYIFGMSDNQIRMTKRIENHEAIIAVNVATGDLISDIERKSANSSSLIASIHSV